AQGFASDQSITPHTAMVQFRVTIIFGALSLITMTVRADIIAPPGLSGGDHFRIAFLTDSTTNATSASVSSYDAIVGAEAVAAGLGTYHGAPVTWAAIVSTSNVSAISRLPADSVPIFLPDGTKIAFGGTALWSTFNAPLNHPINENAFGLTNGS